MLVSHTAVTFLSGDFTPKYGGCLNRLAVAITGSGLRSRQFVLSASRLQDHERRWFYRDFDVARNDVNMRALIGSAFSVRFSEEAPALRFRCRPWSEAWGSIWRHGAGR